MENNFRSLNKWSQPIKTVKNSMILVGKKVISSQWKSDTSLWKGDLDQLKVIWGSEIDLDPSKSNASENVILAK